MAETNEDFARRQRVRRGEPDPVIPEPEPVVPLKAQLDEIVRDTARSILNGGAVVTNWKLNDDEVNGRVMEMKVRFFPPISTCKCDEPDRFGYLCCSDRPHCSCPNQRFTGQCRVCGTLLS